MGLDLKFLEDRPMVVLSVDLSQALSIVSETQKIFIEYLFNEFSIMAA